MKQTTYHKMSKPLRETENSHDLLITAKYYQHNGQQKKLYNINFTIDARKFYTELHTLYNHFSQKNRVAIENLYYDLKSFVRV